MDAFQGDLQVELVSCGMSDHKPYEATEKCMEKAGVSDKYEEILACRLSNYGENLLKEFGDKTEAAEPSINWVPWITIDNVMQISLKMMKPI